MTDTTFRNGKKPFFDNKKFPRGFAKSGDFTLSEEHILVTYGQTMNALESKEYLPENEEEQHFVDALANPELAESKLERVWLKYIQLARGRKRFHTLHGRNKTDIVDDYVDEDAPVSEDD